MARTTWDIESNNSSFAEKSAESQNELERLVREGHIEEIGTWADGCARHHESQVCR